jgi:prepilin-type N-terminal cleavage/methylation domain-containing protein
MKFSTDHYSSRSSLHPSRVTLHESRFTDHGSPAGFTLIELIIATAISALVIGILAVCFSFSLRVWQKAHDRKADQTFLLADLLQHQLAECDTTPVKFPDNSMHPVFFGQANSIAFITSHSVKAISGGVPVVARYTYDPNSKVLSYSELVFNPYYTEAIQNFVEGRQAAGNKKSEIRSYGVNIQGFGLAYGGKGATQFTESWNTNDQVPVEVLLYWRDNDSLNHSIVCLLNTPFPVEAQKTAPITAPITGGTPQ